MAGRSTLLLGACVRWGRVALTIALWSLSERWSEAARTCLRAAVKNVFGARTQRARDDIDQMCVYDIPPPLVPSPSFVLSPPSPACAFETVGETMRFAVS